MQISNATNPMNSVKIFSFAYVMMSVFASNFSSAQVTILENDTSVCVSQPLVFHADVDSGQTAVGLVIADDTYSELITLDFPFTFYGNTYNNLYLSTNAYIKFGGPGGYSPWVITDTDPFPTPNQSAGGGQMTNVIMGPWHDTYPGVGFNLVDAMDYKTVGTAPNRIFVFSFCEVPMYSCTNLYFSGQILLFETTNIIEVHLAHKIVCSSWNSGQAVLGVQDSTGLYATIVPGHNVATEWTATEQAWRFTPDGITNYLLDSIAYGPIPIYSGGGVKWFDNGTLIGTGDSVLTTLPIGEHQIVALVQGCYVSSASDTINVIVGATAANYSQQNVECPTATNGFAVVDILNNNPYQLFWLNASGDTLQTVPNSFFDTDTLYNLGVGAYQLHIIDTIGCETIHDYNITSGTYDASFITDPSIACSGTGITFISTSNETVTDYSWDFGDGSQAFQNNPAHTYYVEGDFNVTLIISNDEDGCTDTTSEIVNVHDVIVADFSHASTYCEGDPVSFSDGSSPYPVEWSWNFGSQGISTIEQPTFTFNDAGTYTVLLNVTDSLCGSDTATQIIVINPFPIVNLEPDNTVICKGQNVTFDAGNPGDTYSWNLGGNGQFVTFTFQGSGSVSVTVNHLGCVASDTVFVDVACFLEMPNAFTPNGDGLNDILIPWGKNVINYQMNIYDRWGKLVYSIKNANLSTNTEGWDGRINGKDAEIGVYSFYVSGTLMSSELVERSGNVTLLR